MAERKIFNFESKILKDRTIEIYGYDPETLGRTSRLYVMATCRYCGKEMRILKGNFNKLGSACHKECRMETQRKQDSPFNNPETQEKAKKKIAELYGENREEIGRRISKTKNTEESKNKYIATCMDKYGTINGFQAEEVKAKIRETNLERYGDASAVRSQEVQDKKRKTNIERYGFSNPMLNPQIKEMALSTFKQTILNNENGKHDIAKMLNSEDFWELLKTKSLTEISKHYGINYYSWVGFLTRPKYKERYYATYSFPTMQTQMDIFNILNEDIGVECQSSNRTIIAPFELDVYVPSHKFAIEYNGVYYHSEHMIKDVSVAQKKHLNKTKKCEEVGVRLFHIFEHQWLTRPKQIINFIRTILGKNSKTIYARHCNLTVNNSDDFVEENHIQGNVNPMQVVRYFNLEYNNEIVASMVASPHHRQNAGEGDIVLSRLCFKDNTNVPGGSSKLFKYFKIWAKENGYKRIISWSDNCWTQGNIYKVLGFDLEREYGPDYFYWDLKNHCYKSKQSQRKNSTNCPKELTEREWAIQNGLTRIWDCGKKKWVYEI